jgi:hypothetical protein
VWSRGKAGDHIKRLPIVTESFTPRGCQRNKGGLLPDRKSLGILFIILGAIIFLIKSISDISDNVWADPTLFYIGGTGEVISQFPVKDGEVSYSVSFDNPTKRTFKIVSIEPILTRRGQDVLIGDIRPIEEVKSVKPGKQVEFSGKINVNTSGFTEEDIRNMIPLIDAYKVVFNRQEEIILKLRK